VVRLEEVKAGVKIKGITGDTPVTVIAVTWHGSVAIAVTFKEINGNLSDLLLFREKEESLDLVESENNPCFDANAEIHCLTSEAYRIKLAHLFDQYLCVHTSSIDPLPHQISAVYAEMLPRLPLRYVLADDPGAGKTIMTGLYIKELIAREEVKRCMIVTPGSLSLQWQEELYRKFDLNFDLLTKERFANSPSGNIFTETHLCIVRLDMLVRNLDEIKILLGDTYWDLIVVDEAHKMSATYWGAEKKTTKRYQLGQFLSNITRHFLLLTATPHNGKEVDFQLFMALIDPDRFEYIKSRTNETIEVGDLMRRYVKEDLLKFDGTPLFPERRAYTVNYDLSPDESLLYDAVTDYVQTEFSRADQLESNLKTTVGFALTILQRRLASSPEAIYQSLKRRRERLETKLHDQKKGILTQIKLPTFDDDFDPDDLLSDELELDEDEIVDYATTARTITELEVEIEVLINLEKQAEKVRNSKQDRKWDELSKLIQDDILIASPDGPEKLIIFTEHRDTLTYLYNRLYSVIGNPDAIKVIHGGVKREDRRKVEEQFMQNKDVRILIATDAAGEGINLQRAHLMINYDLPWNPNRIEQRFGRIHRIGQTEVCHLWNLVSYHTREGMVFQRLLTKLEQQNIALNGKVFNVLGNVTFDNKPLRDLLISAIRYGKDPQVIDHLNQVIDDSFELYKLQKLIDERALVSSTMGIAQVTTIRDDMLRNQAHKLQPHYISKFFTQAFKTLGGSIYERENGRYEIKYVPSEIINTRTKNSFHIPLISKYERICFDKTQMKQQHLLPATLIAPGHPLLDATIDIYLQRHLHTLSNGTILIDPLDLSTFPRMLLYIEGSIVANNPSPAGNFQTLSKQLHFVEIATDGRITDAGYAPYLDYRAPNNTELQNIHNYLDTQKVQWTDLETQALDYAYIYIVHPHLQSITQQKMAQIEKTEREVKNRMGDAIAYHDNLANQKQERAETGKKQGKIDSIMERKTADELETRMRTRLTSLQNQKAISARPPMIIGRTIIIPAGLLSLITGDVDPQTIAQYAKDTQLSERKAMQTVLDIETKLGYQPEDVSASNLGYDILSRIPPEKLATNETPLRLIEVKGRIASADTVTVSRNEINTALNTPDNFILAIVRIDGTTTKTTYLKEPFTQMPQQATASINFNIAKLIKNSKVVYSE